MLDYPQPVTPVYGCSLLAYNNFTDGNPYTLDHDIDRPEFNILPLLSHGNGPSMGKDVCDP